MLDAFLEVACGREKMAAQKTRNMELLGKLPTETLQKIACGGLGGYGGEGWLEKFQGSPLLGQAIAIEKEELAIQMEESQRRAREREVRESMGSWEDTAAKRDELAVKRRLLELELVGGPSAVSPAPAVEEDPGLEPELAAPAEDPAVDVAPSEGAAAPPKGLRPHSTEVGNGGADPGAEVDTPETDPSEAADPPKPKPKAEAKEKTVEKTTEKPVPEKIDVKTSEKEAAARFKFAAARLRFSQAVKEAQPANGQRPFHR
jgi:hypothetical protein